MSLPIAAASGLACATRTPGFIRSSIEREAERVALLHRHHGAHRGQRERPPRSGPSCGPPGCSCRRRGGTGRPAATPRRRPTASASRRTGVGPRRRTPPCTPRAASSTGTLTPAAQYTTSGGAAGSPARDGPRASRTSRATRAARTARAASRTTPVRLKPECLKLECRKPEWLTPECRKPEWRKNPRRLMTRFRGWVGPKRHPAQKQHDRRHHGNGGRQQPAAQRAGRRGGGQRPGGARSAAATRRGSSAGRVAGARATGRPCDSGGGGARRIESQSAAISRS